MKKTITELTGKPLDFNEKLTPYNPRQVPESGLCREFYSQGILILNRKTDSSILFSWSELEKIFNNCK